MLSYTRIKTYQTCPKQYEYKYVKEVKPLPTQVITQGLTEHAKITSPENVPEFFKTAFKKNFLNPVFEERLKEDFFTFELEGVIDCYSINNPLTCFIVDWKLYGIPENDEQLKIYALLLKKKNPDLLFFTAYFVSLKGNFYKRFTYSEEDIKEFENNLIELADKIMEAEEKGKFPAKPGDHCAFCPFIKDCYDGAKLPDPSTIAITSMEEARELAYKVLIADAFLKQIKDQLKQFLLQEGLEELAIDDKNRVYLSPSISLRFGKLNGKSRTSRSKKA